jgi:hypothetical protein
VSNLCGCLQIKEAESIFKEVDEEEYSEIVAKRRQDDFVEDDGEKIGLVILPCFSFHT